MNELLAKSFYQQPTVDVARKLLGKILVHKTLTGTTAGRIVETEAYLFKNDPAAHSFRGQTTRNKAMFAQAGSAYVYLIYGIHYCFNVVTAPVGEGEAVLVRALEPILGQELMTRRRGVEHKLQLASGPGKLCQAMGIDLTHNGADLTQGPLYLTEDDYQLAGLTTSTRIGILVAKDEPLRFYESGNPYVSRK